MTAVAAPLQLRWNNNNNNGQGGGAVAAASTMTADDMSRLFMPAPRKTVQRANSSSSINSTLSSASTIAPPSAQANGALTGPADGWATRKKPSRGIWPPGKSDPTAGLSTARPHPVSSTSSGPSAASAISALHSPLLTSQQQMVNGQAQQNGSSRNAGPAEVSALLYLSPMNGTFEKKTINVPYYPDVLRIGRQTNVKTAPTPINGFFDSKVLSRQHAEVYAERNGRIYIRDVKSSNGTFVNGQRLSPENKESEPHELREQDVLELGIDIVSEDQKTVVHHKVAARVEHAGIYGQGTEINFGELDPSGGSQFMSAQQMKRTGSHASQQGAKQNAMAAAMAAREGSAIQQQAWSRMWLQPISAEQIVKRLNRELGLARQQSHDITRAWQSVEGMPGGESDIAEKENQQGTKPPLAKIKPPYSEPPAPPPQQPLPEKPDVVKALEDPAILPLLHRSNTFRPMAMNSPIRHDTSQAIIVLTQELKMAREQIPSLEDRVKTLELQLTMERVARETAEELAQRLEHASRKDSAELNDRGNKSEDVDRTTTELVAPSLQAQLDRLHASMSDMKQQMEAYRRRAESAETERDQVRLSLVELVEEKRKRNADEAQQAKRSPSPSPSQGMNADDRAGQDKAAASQQAISPIQDRALDVTELLQNAGVDTSKPLTTEQAASLRTALSTPAFSNADPDAVDKAWTQQLSYHGVPHACALSTVVLGLALMHYLNAWDKVQR